MRRIHILVGFSLVLPIGCGKAPPPTRVNYWVEALRAPDARVRKKAAFTLGNLNATDSAVVPALQASLRDTDAAVRREAILALMKCGSIAVEALPSLTEMSQRDPDALVRTYAAKAVQRLQEGKRSG